MTQMTVHTSRGRTCACRPGSGCTDATLSSGLIRRRRPEPDATCWSPHSSAGSTLGGSETCRPLENRSRAVDRHVGRSRRIGIWANSRKPSTIPNRDGSAAPLSIKEAPPHSDSHAAVAAAAVAAAHHDARSTKLERGIVTTLGYRRPCFTSWPTPPAQGRQWHRARRDQHRRARRLPHPRCRAREPRSTSQLRPANRSVARMSSAVMPAWFAPCPASSTTTSSPAGHARCSSHAVPNGDWKS
jgi:hypothetical protein